MATKEDEAAVNGSAMEVDEPAAPKVTEKEPEPIAQETKEPEAKDASTDKPTEPENQPQQQNQSETNENKETESKAAEEPLKEPKSQQEPQVWVGNWIFLATPLVAMIRRLLESCDMRASLILPNANITCSRASNLVWFVFPGLLWIIHLKRTLPTLWLVFRDLLLIELDLNGICLHEQSANESRRLHD